jgi:hypothetical protein
LAPDAEEWLPFFTQLRARAVPVLRLLAGRPFAAACGTALLLQKSAGLLRAAQAMAAAGAAAGGAAGGAAGAGFEAVAAAAEREHGAFAHFAEALLPSLPAGAGVLQEAGLRTANDVAQVAQCLLDAAGLQCAAVRAAGKAAAVAARGARLLGLLLQVGDSPTAP